MNEVWASSRLATAGLAAFFLAAAGGAVLMAAAIGRANRAYRDSAAQADGARQTLDASGDLRVAVRDAELGARGYIVTGELSYRRAYEAAYRQVPAKWLELRSLEPKMLPGAGTSLEALGPLVAAKLDALAAIAKYPPRPAADPAYRSLVDRNDRALGALDGGLDDLEKRQTRRLGEAEAREQALTRELRALTFLQVFSALAVVGGVLVLLARQTLHRRRAERKAAGSEDVMRTVFESMAEGVIVADAKGRALVFNPTAERLLGGRPEQADTGDWAQLRGVYRADGVTPARPEEMPLVRALSGQSTDRMDFCLRRPGDVKPVFMSVTGRPLRGPGGAVIGGVAVFFDVTERRRADEEIRRLNRDLQGSVSELSSANRELEGFTFSVSHGLRAPLRALDGFSRLLDRRLPEADAEAKRLLGIIQVNAKRMGGLMDDLLAYTDLARRPLRACAVDMRKLVAGVFEEAVRAQDGRRPDLTLDPLPAAHADPEMLREAWLNLLANAIKFSGHAARPVVEVGTAGGNGKTIYFVRDNGVGFNMRYAHRLFGVFQRLHGTDEFEGSGIGLAIVKRIVERHGGQVWAQAEEGVGATFYLSLPTEAEASHDGLA